MKGVRNGKTLITVGEMRLGGAKQRVPASRDRQSSALAPHGIRHGGCLRPGGPKSETMALKRWGMLRRAVFFVVRFVACCPGERTRFFCTVDQYFRQCCAK